eukprot:28538_1
MSDHHRVRKRGSKELKPSRPRKSDERTKKVSPDSSPDLEIPSQFYSGANIMHNVKVVMFCRILASLLAGCCSGILGLTGLAGLILFALAWLLTSALLWTKTKFDHPTYFRKGSALWMDGLMQGGMSFVLFWTLVHNIVHIYG